MNSRRNGIERLKYVEENFKSGLKKGIKSDMGKGLYVLWSSIQN